MTAAVTDTGLALRRAVAANPTDEEARRAYRDYLDEAGDPLGEYMRLAERCDTPEDRARLAELEGNTFASLITVRCASCVDGLVDGHRLCPVCYGRYDLGRLNPHANGYNGITGLLIDRGLPYSAHVPFRNLFSLVAASCTSCAAGAFRTVGSGESRCPECGAAGAAWRVAPTDTLRSIATWHPVVRLYPDNTAPEWDRSGFCRWDYVPARRLAQGDRGPTTVPDVLLRYTTGDLYESYHAAVDDLAQAVAAWARAVIAGRDTR